MTTIKKIAMLMGAVAILALSAPAIAANDPAATTGQTFGVVDMNKIMSTTDAAKDIFSQLENKRKEYQGQISKEEDALHSAEQEITKQKDTLSKDDFEKKAKEFQDKIMSGQKLVQDRKSILDYAFNSSLSALRNEAAKIVADEAKEKGYSAVFTQDAVMISIPSLDMTDAVIARMNKNVKKIAVDWSAAAAATGETAPKSGKKK